jgi:hypothetical protein
MLIAIRAGKQNLTEIFAGHLSETIGAGVYPLRGENEAEEGLNSLFRLGEMVRRKESSEVLC